MNQSLEGDFNPAAHFLGLLKKAVNDGIARRCSIVGGPQIVIAPRQVAYFSASIKGQDLRSLCQAEPFDLQIEALPDWNPEAEEGTIQVGRMRLRSRTSNSSVGLAAKPLAELLWLATISASNGHLLQGCRANESVRLKNLPDASLIGDNNQYQLVAKFMHENNTDLLTVAKRTGIALGEVYDFHNACAVLGLIERGNIFEAEEYFLGIIQQCLRDGQMRRCGLAGLPPVFLSPKDRRYYVCQSDFNETLATYFLANLRDMRVEEVTSFNLGEESEEEMIQIGRVIVRRKKESKGPSLAARSLDELIWGATIKASKGRLLAGKRGHDVVRLKRWPDFSRLSNDRGLLPLAAFMSVNAADLHTVAKHTGISMDQVIDFHNACAVLDYLEYLPEQRLQKRPVSEQERTTFRRISERLGGIRAATHAG